MLVSDLFAEIHMAITSNRVRTGLTVLGIVIGIASVIVMLAIGTGSQVQIEESIASAGSNLLTIQPEKQRSFGGGSQSSGSAETLSMDDVSIIEDIENVAIVAPLASGNQRVIANGNNQSTTINGVTSSYFEASNIAVEDGSELTDTHDKKRSRVAIIGSTLRDDIFGEGIDAVGEKLRIDSSDFTIIGVTEEKGGSMFGSSDSAVFIPISTYQQYFQGDDHLSTISVSISEQDAMEQAEEDIMEALFISHGFDSEEDADFEIRSQADMMEMASTITGTLTVLLGAVAGISLVVGGIGIMNMMLTTVTERTREIGLRKSIGANESDISQQFLYESVALTFIGGMIGVALGVGISIALDHFGVVTTYISTFSIGLSFGVSAVIGIVFGYYPARRAAKLSPIEALRYE